MNVLNRVRRQLTYANVMATIAVFLALGGASYAAIELPRNSVGARELRSASVGASDLKRGAVSSRAIRDATIRTRDLAASTRRGLTGPPGPAGSPAITLRAAIASSGGVISGNATSQDEVAPNKRLLGFSRSLTGCVPTGTLSRVPGGLITDPGPGRIVVGVEGDFVGVETFDAAGAPRFLPFTVIVAC